MGTHDHAIIGADDGVSVVIRRWNTTAALCALLLVPASASAHHTTCTTSAAFGPVDDSTCPPFDPNIVALVSNPYFDSPSGITFRWTETDHHASPIAWRASIGKGWRFDFASLRAGQARTGAPATRCEDVYDADGINLRLVRAEALSSAVGISIAFDKGSSGSTTRTTLKYGYPTSKTARTHAISNLSFLNWEPVTETATLCLLVSTASAGPPGVPASLIVPITVTRLATSTLWDWQVRADTSFIDSAPFTATASSIVQATFAELPSRTKGNWNRNRVSGALEGEFLSRTPFAPTNTDMRVEMDACLEGLDGGACRNGTTVTTASDFSFPITPVPERRIRDFGHVQAVGQKLTGGVPSHGDIQPAGFSLINGAQDATVVWSPPNAGDDLAVRGYVLVVAEPNDQSSRHFEYVVTQPFIVDAYGAPVLDGDGQPIPASDLDARAPCGPSGAADFCSLSLSFPLTGETHLLTGNGKYNVALVTIWTDGKRSDGRCDDGTAEGIQCDPADQPAQIVSPGISVWQFLMLPEAWPNVFMESSTTPVYVLTVDYARKAAEFFVWGPRLLENCRAPTAPRPSVPSTDRLPATVKDMLDQEQPTIDTVFDTVDTALGTAYDTVPVGHLVCGTGRAPANAKDALGAHFVASANTIQGAAQEGTFDFGNFKPDGSVASYEVTGVTVPDVFVNATKVASSVARAVFMFYSPNNWTPGSLALPPQGTCVTGPCTPSTIVEVFEGTRVLV